MMKNEGQKLKIGYAVHDVFQNEPKNIPRQDILSLNIPLKFKGSSYNIEGARGVTVKSLHTAAEVE